MRRLLWLVFLTTTALSILIVLACSIFATRAGEIALESNRTGNWEIFLLDLQTGIVRNLTHDRADDFTPAWSPNGRQIAFVSDRDGDKQQELYVMDEDGGHLERIASGNGQFANPMWTSDGHSLVSMHGWQQLYLVDTVTRSEQRIGTGFSPRLSPDGKSLLYYADGVNTDVYSNIYVLDLKSRHVTDLTAGTIHNWGGSWSPNGREIVFVSLKTGKSGIYVMNADGSNYHAVATSTNNVTPAWSPDGKQIVYASGSDGSMQLYIMNADGSNQHAITDTGDNHAPAWQP
jgi:TolB protein